MNILVDLTVHLLQEALRLIIKKLQRIKTLQYILARKKLKFNLMA